jgi:hypothetical protein
VAHTRPRFCSSVQKSSRTRAARPSSIPPRITENYRGASGRNRTEPSPLPVSGPIATPFKVGLRDRARRPSWRSRRFFATIKGRLSSRRACSAVGSAPEWHSGGHRFDPGQVHQLQAVDSKRLKSPPTSFIEPPVAEGPIVQRSPEPLRSCRVPPLSSPAIATPPRRGSEASRAAVRPEGARLEIDSGRA